MFHLKKLLVFLLIQLAITSSLSIAPEEHVDTYINVVYNLKASPLMVGMSVYKVFFLINGLVMNSRVINVTDGGISGHPNCLANDRCKLEQMRGTNEPPKENPRTSGRGGGQLENPSLENICSFLANLYVDLTSSYGCVRESPIAESNRCYTSTNLLAEYVLRNCLLYTSPSPRD